MKKIKIENGTIKIKAKSIKDFLDIKIKIDKIYGFEIYFKLNNKDIYSRLFSSNNASVFVCDKGGEL